MINYPEITNLLSMFIQIVMFLLLFESHYPKKVTILASVFCMGGLCIINIALGRFYGLEFLSKVVLFTFSIPSFLFFFLFSEYQDGRFIFTFCLIDILSLSIMVLAGICEMFLQKGYFIILFARLILFTLMFLGILRWRSAYHRILRSQSKGWNCLACVSVLIYLLLLVSSTYPTVFHERPEYSVTFLLLILTIFCTYIILFKTIDSMDKTNMALQAEQLLSFQLSAQKQNISQFLVNRHDLRHHIRAISALLEAGDLDNAKEYLDSLEAGLQKSTLQRYCENNIVNAALSMHLDHAKSIGVQVKTELTIPEKTFMDDTELCVIFSNAAENAVHSCTLLSSGEKRQINLKSLCDPSKFVFETTNTFYGTVRFDENGLPLSQLKGHGIGTRSIAAIVKKYGGVVNYSAEGGWFTLQVLLFAPTVPPRKSPRLSSH